MKFNFSKDTTTEGVLALASVVAGVMVSNSLVAITPADQKQLSQGGLAIGGTVVSTGLAKDKSMPGKIVKMVALGAAAKQGYDVVTGLVKDKVSVNTENPSLTDKMMAGALGLGCPDCEGSHRALAAAPAMDFRGLIDNDVRMLDDQPQLEESSVSALA